jgi:two-component system, chemotaxis family, chemotaxis protein CheY
MKVLLVDDSSVMRKIIARTLRNNWIDEVVEAGDGLQAIDAFGDGSGFDLVVTDLSMPNMNGLELVTVLRGAGHKLPIVMIMSEMDRTQFTNASQAGVTDYLVKPFDSELLIHKLERLLPTSIV